MATSDWAGNSSGARGMDGWMNATDHLAASIPSPFPEEEEEEEGNGRFVACFLAFAGRSRRKGREVGAIGTDSPSQSTNCLVITHQGAPQLIFLSSLFFPSG
jgi:hypothetical protein